MSISMWFAASPDRAPGASSAAALTLRLAGQALLVVAMSAAPALAQQKPNVLFILTDDLDTALLQTGLDAGIYPQIQRVLIDAGTQFTESFVSNALCCPSRSTYLSGQYAHNHGVYSNSGPFGGFKVFDDSSTLATWMLDAGYRTGHVGKYLNGYKDYRYVPPGWTTWNAMVGGSAYCMYDYRVSEDGLAETPYGNEAADYQTDVLSNYADRFLRTSDSRPFFLTVAPLSPHNEACIDKTPEKPYGTVRAALRHIGSVNLPLPSAGLASFNESDMSDKPAWMQKIKPNSESAQQVLFNEKLAALKAVDDMVGRLFDTLVETGKSLNTVIIFSSDNGYQYGSHRLLQKGTLYEEAIRVPLVVRGRAQSVPRVSAQWVLNTDWAPTIAEYGNARPRIPVDGRSIVALVDGVPVPAWRQSMLLERPFDGGSEQIAYPYAAVRTQDPSLAVRAGKRSVAVYAETFDLVTGILSDLELYDLAIDPLQLTSLHDSSDPRRIRQMNGLKDKLDQLRVCGGRGAQACAAAEN
jgi:N-acetylglucosamine-6-sulfatase